MNEQSWILVGQPVSGGWLATKRRHIGGKAASVEADWRWALAREEQRGDVIGFFHTHPRGFGTQPSDRDIQTIQAWCSAFGKPLLCLIADGRTLTAYVFENDESVGQIAKVKLIKVAKFFINAAI